MKELSSQHLDSDDDITAAVDLFLQVQDNDFNKQVIMSSTTARLSV